MMSGPVPPGLYQRRANLYFRNGGNPSGSRLGFPDHLDDVRDDLFNKARIIRLRHDAYQRFRAGGPDHQAAFLAEPAAGILDGGPDGAAFQRLAARKADIPQELRHRLELLADFADRFVLALDAG